MGRQARYRMLVLAASLAASPCRAEMPITLLTAGDYRLAPLAIGATTRPRATPLLDRLFAPMAASGQRRRSTELALGDLTLTAEALRVRTIDTLAGLDGRAVTTERRLAGGLSALWSVGAEDGLSFGVATSRRRGIEPALLAGRKHIGSTTLDADIAWTHGTDWRFDGGWERVGGSVAAAGAERLVQIAQGAALHEQGFRMALLCAPGGLAADRGASFGLEARAMRLAADDLALLGAAGRRDARALAFARWRF